jgi:hypothetical protein
MKYLYKKIKIMRQLFKIDESEKKRILEMHENATKRNYLTEQSNTDPLVSKQGGTQLTSTFDDEFGKPQTSTTNVALPGIQDFDTLNKFAYNWGGKSLCDKMKYLEQKKLKDVYNYTTERMCKRVSGDSPRTAADVLKNTIDKALLNIAQNINDLNKIAAGTIGQNTMSIENPTWAEFLKYHPNLPEVIRAIAMEQVKPIMASVQSAVGAAKSGMSKM